LRILRHLSYAVCTALVVGAGSAVTAQDWRSDRDPAGLAPDPAKVNEAVVQVYGARTRGAKGFFGVHTWVAAKPTGASEWTVYEVIGWRLRWSDSAVVVRHRSPDSRWYGAPAELYAERRGAGVDELIERIEKAVKDYPYANTYTVYPGPNSNTFTAWIARAVPELEVDLPATAIGKDYLGGSFISTAPSGSGIQLSLGGLLGIAASGVEGLELNLLGLNFGVSATGVKLPFVGRLGPAFKSAVAAEPVPVPRALVARP
jgi:hypothetical protein